MLDSPRFVPGDFVTVQGTRSGACFRILECLGVIQGDALAPGRRWYTVDVNGVPVSVCEGDLKPVEVVSELGRIVGG